jgi:hypothetical protein
MIGIPPPFSDPELEARNGQTPKQRLESVAFGLVAITILVVIAAVVMSVL